MAKENPAKGSSPHDSGDAAPVESTVEPGTQPEPLRKRFGFVLRAWLIFVVSVAVLFQALIWARPFTDTTFCRWIASVSSWALRVLGLESRTRDTLIISSIGTLEIIRECTGVYPTALYLAAVFAYPCSWRRKLIGAVGGILAIQLFNQIRIVSLFYIQKYYPDFFMSAHLVVWQSLMVFLTGLIWLVWAIEFTGRPKQHAS